MRRHALVLMLLASQPACPKPMSYAYQERLPASAFGPADSAEPAGREARQLLSMARTVAFYPPDYCINVDKDEVARNRTLRANCGVLLSSVPSYKDRVINEGSIYHVMTYGLNSMGSYANQVNQHERWLIASYVVKLKSKL